MKCPKCAFDNPEDARFCAECGGPIEFHCPQCGEETLAARFVRSATVEGVATVDGRPTKRLEELYFNLADGEIALIITSVAFIEGEPYRRRLYVEDQVYPLLMDDDRMEWLSSYRCAGLLFANQD